MTKKELTARVEKLESENEKLRQALWEFRGTSQAVIAAIDPLKLTTTLAGSLLYGLQKAAEE